MSYFRHRARASSPLDAQSVTRACGVLGRGRSPRPTSRVSNMRATRLAILCKLRSIRPAARGELGVRRPAAILGRMSPARPGLHGTQPQNFPPAEAHARGRRAKTGNVPMPSLCRAPALVKGRRPWYNSCVAARRRRYDATQLPVRHRKTCTTWRRRRTRNMSSLRPRPAVTAQSPEPCKRDALLSAADGLSARPCQNGPN